MEAPPRPRNPMPFPQTGGTQPLEEPAEAVRSDPRASQEQGVDYVTLLGLVVLGVVGSISLFVGETTIAGTAVGAVGGVLFRIYR